MTRVDVTGSGESLVLIHGLATTRSIWRHVAPRLAATREVVTLDVPGFGAARPVGRGFDLEAVAADVADGLRASTVREPYDLVGHSMGAAVALTLAAREPDAVRSLVLVSPAGLRPIPFLGAAALGMAAEVYIPLRRRAAVLAGWSWGRRLLMAGGVVDAGALQPAVVRQLVSASDGARRIGPALSAVAGPLLLPPSAAGDPRQPRDRVRAAGRRRGPALRAVTRRASGSGALSGPRAGDQGPSAFPDAAARGPTRVPDASRASASPPPTRRARSSGCRRPAPGAR
jgi:pimeloyl-ACP methyl ester carboxylesterase